MNVSLLYSTVEKGKHNVMIVMTFEILYRYLLQEGVLCEFVHVIRVLNFTICIDSEVILSSNKMLGINENFPEYAVPGAKQVRFEPYADNGGSIVAIAGEDFAVIGADTRLSTGFSIYTREQKKLFRLSDKTVLGATGCWCDTLTLTRLLHARMQMYEHEHNKSMTTPAVAQMLSTMLYYKRFFPYYVSNILAGLDADGKGCVYSYDPIGHCERSNYRAGGSAGAQLQPLLDNQIGLKNMQNVTEAPLPREKALSLLKDVFISAAERDIYTGDCIYILIITASGIQEEKFELRKD